MKFSNVNDRITGLFISSLSAGKIAEKAMWRSVYLTIWHRILNADSTKLPHLVLLFSDFAGWVVSKKNEGENI